MGKSIILRGFDQEFIKDFVPSLVEEYQLTKIYWITEKSRINPASLECEVEFIDFNFVKFLETKDANSLPALSADLVNALKETESHVMTMFERNYIGHLSYMQRRHYYFQALKYWHSIIDEDVLFCLFDILPHAFYDYTLYGLAEVLDLPFYFTDNILPGATLLWEDWKKCPVPSKSENSISKEILEPLQYQIDYQNSDEPIPYYMNSKDLVNIKSLQKRDQQKRKEQQSSRNSIFKKMTFQAFQRLFYLKINLKLNHYLYRKRLKRLSNDDPDLSVKYIYCALHLQPEVSTGPRAGIFVDQLNIIDVLRKSVPPDVHIYVKENPKQNSIMRPAEFYNEIQKFKNVKLISKTVNSFDLLKNSIAIATATGTVGWEAMFRDKPALIFGEAFYQNAPHVYKVSTVENCSVAISEIIKNPVEHYEKEAFIASLNDKLILCNVDEYRNIVCPVENSAQNLLQEFKKALSQRNTKN